MKIVIIFLLALMVGGCSMNPNTYGYKPEDPCIRCGEGWIFLPNTPSRD